MNNRQNEHLTTTHFLDISGTQLYVVPLRTAADTASKVISKKAIDTIFGNVEEIITISHVCLFLTDHAETPPQHTLWQTGDDSDA